MFGTVVMYIFAPRRISTTFLCILFDPQEYEIVRRLLKSMLERHPEKRIDVKDILLDPVIRKRLENPPDSE